MFIKWKINSCNFNNHCNFIFFVSRLPDEILLKIFKFLTPSELLVCAKVCHQWTTVTKERLMKKKLNLWYNFFWCLRTVNFTMLIARWLWSLIIIFWFMQTVTQFSVETAASKISQTSQKLFDLWGNARERFQLERRDHQEVSLVKFVWL